MYLLINQLIVNGANEDFVFNAKQLRYTLGNPLLHDSPVYLLQIDLQVQLFGKFHLLHLLLCFTVTRAKRRCDGLQAMTITSFKPQISPAHLENLAS